MDVPIANLRRGNVIMWQERPVCVSSVTTDRLLCTLRLTPVEAVGSVDGLPVHAGRAEYTFQTRPIAASLSVSWRASKGAKIRAARN